MAKKLKLTAECEWQDATTSAPELTDSWLCLSVPGDKEYPRQIGTWNKERWTFLNLDDEPISGVTFWCYLPEPPEDMNPALKKSSAPEASTSQPAPTEPFKLEGQQ